MTKEPRNHIFFVIDIVNSTFRQYSTKKRQTGTALDFEKITISDYTKRAFLANQHEVAFLNNVVISQEG